MRFSGNYDARIGQGRENAKHYLREHPDVTTEIEQQVRRELGLTAGAAEEQESMQEANGNLSTDEASGL